MADTVYTPLESVDFSKLKIESYDRLTLFDRTSDDLLVMLEDLKDFTLSQTVDSQEQTGKRGTVLSVMDRNKGVNGSGNNAYVVTNAIAAQVGADIEHATKEAPLSVPHIEKLRVAADGTVTLPKEYEPVGEAGVEVPAIYSATVDITQDKKYTIGAAVSATEFTYDPTTRKISLPVIPAKAAVGTEGQDGYQPATEATPVFKPGDVVIVPYRRKATVGVKITNNAEKYAKSGRCVLDLTASDICNDNIKRHVVIECPYVHVDGNFDLAGGDEVMQQPFGFRSMPDPCSVDKSLWDMYVA